MCSRCLLTVRGPLLEQIDEAVKLVLDAVTDGITPVGSGFTVLRQADTRVDPSHHVAQNAPGIVVQLLLRLGLAPVGVALTRGRR